MYKITDFDDQITKALVAKDLEHQAAHTPSGKLSASMLGEPLQWQILKTLGVGTRIIEPYVLRKFARGNDTEKWYIENLGAVVKEKQKLVEYRGAIGYVDLMAETNVPSHSKTAFYGLIPFEVKSVSNAKWKHITTRKMADENHLLQGAFYAMATKSNYFGLTYIASDDYRTLTWIFKTEDYADEVNTIITNYELQLVKQEVPPFNPRYSWQAKLEYCKYPEWMNLTQKELNMAMLLPEYRDAWEKLKTKQNDKSKSENQVA